MSSQYSELDDKQIAFIAAQHLFFVGTAAESGRVNLSPKGRDSLKVLGPNKLLWLNLTGSGNETAAHLQRVNRMTVMFCSYDKQPLILRLYGTAKTIHPRDAQWQDMISQFPRPPVLVRSTRWKSRWCKPPAALLYRIWISSQSATP